MNRNVLKFFRSIQVYFPGLQDLKFGVQRSWRSIIDRTHEREFELVNIFTNSPHSVFVDIGANRGDAIQSMLMRQPDATIFAFEPNGYLVTKLEKLYNNDQRVKILNFGLGSIADNFDLYVPFYNNYMFDGLASFKEKNARDWLRNRIYGYKENKLDIKQIKCEVRRLDDFAINPCFVKIDVQGFEYEVLQGARATLEKSRPVILMESPGHNELDLLYSLEYQPFILKDDILRAGTKNYNVFFIPEEAIVPLQKKFHIEQNHRRAA